MDKLQNIYELDAEMKYTFMWQMVSQIVVHLLKVPSVSRHYKINLMRIIFNLSRHFIA